MNVSRKPTPLRPRALRWVGMLVLVLASGCRDHGGGSGGGSSASTGDWDQLVWDQSDWT